MPRRTVHDLNPKVGDQLIARLISGPSYRVLISRDAAKPRPISPLILAGKETLALLVKSLQKFDVADLRCYGDIRLNNDEKHRRGDSCYVSFEDFCHLFNCCDYKPAVKITGNWAPVSKLLELKDIRQLDLNDHRLASSDAVAKLISQNSATLKRLIGVPRAFFKRLPHMQLEFLSINGSVSPSNVYIPNVKAKCFEYPQPPNGYSSAFFIKRIDAEEIIVSARDLNTSDKRPHIKNVTVKRFRIQFDHAQSFDLPRLLQDVQSAYPNLEQLFLEDRLDRNATTLVRELHPQSDLNGILSSLQEVAGKTTFNITYVRFKRFALIGDASVPSTDDVPAGFKLIREKNHTSGFVPRRNRLYRKRGSLANFEFLVEFELEEKL